MGCSALTVVQWCVLPAIADAEEDGAGRGEVPQVLAGSTLGSGSLGEGRAGKPGQLLEFNECFQESEAVS